MSDFHEFVAELFGPLGPISVKRMFGGAGVYCRDVMFGLIADDTLYLKVDDESRALFDAEGLSPFSYRTKSGKRAAMSFYECPSRLFDDPDEAHLWGRRAYDAALRTRGEKAPKARAKRAASRSRT